MGALLDGGHSTWSSEDASESAGTSMVGALAGAAGGDGGAVKAVVLIGLVTR